MDNKKINVFGLRYDNVTLDEAVGVVEGFIELKAPRMVSTTGAELIVKAHSDNSLKDIYSSADLLTVDSQVVYLAARLLGKPFKEPVSAARLMFRFLELTQNKSYRLYFLGAKEDVLKKAVDNLKDRYPGVNIAGFHHGYFDFENDSKIVDDIIEAKPDVLFVAMSSPLKEKFISKNIKKMGVPVSFAVGGSVDIAAGECKLAPRWMTMMGLEWFYRFIQEPARLWKRYITTNFVFIWIVLREFMRHEKNCIS